MSGAKKVPPPIPPRRTSLNPFLFDLTPSPNPASLNPFLPDIQRSASTLNLTSPTYPAPSSSSFPSPGPAPSSSSFLSPGPAPSSPFLPHLERSLSSSNLLHPAPSDFTLPYPSQPPFNPAFLLPQFPTPCLSHPMPLQPSPLHRTHSQPSPLHQTYSQSDIVWIQLPEIQQVNPCKNHYCQTPQMCQNHYCQTPQMCQNHYCQKIYPCLCQVRHDQTCSTQNNTTPQNGTNHQGQSTSQNGTNHQDQSTQSDQVYQDEVIYVDQLLNVQAELPHLGPLYQACFRDDIREVEVAKAVKDILLRRLDAPTRTDSEKNTVLHHMSAKGNCAVVRLLIQHGAVVDAFNKYGQTSLHAATSMPQNNFGTVKILIDNGANCAYMSCHAETPLHFACFQGHQDIVELMLKKMSKDNVNIQGAYELTALHNAAMQGNARVIKMLLKKGALVNLVTQDGRSALHFACAKGHLKAVSVLLANGANPEVEDADGFSPAALAAIYGHAKKLSSERGLTAGSSSSNFSATSSAVSTRNKINWNCLNCKQRPIECALSDCMHPFCKECAQNLRKCPRCRKENRNRLLVEIVSTVVVNSLPLLLF